jgi:hypothetical protein
MIILTVIRQFLTASPPPLPPDSHTFMVPRIWSATARLEEKEVGGGVGGSVVKVPCDTQSKSLFEREHDI